MSVPRLPKNLATIRQISTSRFQIAGITDQPKNHFRKDFTHVDYSNDRTVVRFSGGIFFHNSGT
jgi:hypothetical protein